MKLFSRMLSKKTEAEESVGNLDLDMDVEPLRSRKEPRADDSGEINASELSQRDEGRMSAKSKSRAFSRGLDDDLTPGLAPDPAPDPAPQSMDSAWDDDTWDDEDWDDDEDWGDEDDLEADGPAAAKADDKEHLVDEIREAMGAVSHVQPDTAAAPEKPARQQSEVRNWAEDEEFGRRAIARSQLTNFGGDAEDRILAETNSQMTDRETSRRRSAMAHLKAAAAATKADAVLKHVVGRDPSGDPEEQSPYRDDLAKVVRPRSTSRPISRPVSRPRSKPAEWETGMADEDAALFADSDDGFGEDTLEAELRAAEEERLARAPADLSEEDFSDDTPMSSTGKSDGGFEKSRFRSDFNAFSDEEDPETEAFDEDDEDDTDMIASSGPEMPSDDVDHEEEQPAFGAITPSEPDPEPEIEPIVNVAAPVSGRAGRGAGRVKTRLLGFQPGDTASQDIFAATAAKAAAMREQKEEELNEAPLATTHTQFPSGWIVVIDGPGRGACFTTFSGVSQIGRGEDQAVRLDFGDTSISRNNHAAIAYDDEQGKFFLGHGGKSNLVRLNGRPVLSTEELANGDEIRIGETTLKFIALCGEDFVWTRSEEEDAE